MPYRFDSQPADLVLLGTAIGGPAMEPHIPASVGDADQLWSARAVEEQTLSGGPFTLSWPVLAGDLQVWQEATIERRDSTLASTLRLAGTQRYRARYGRWLEGSEQVVVDGTTFSRTTSDPGSGEYRIDSYEEGLFSLPEISMGSSCTVTYRYRANQWRQATLPGLSQVSPTQFSIASIQTDTYLLDYAVDLGTWGLLQAYHWVQPDLQPGQSVKLVRLDLGSLASATLSPFTISARYPGAQYNGIQLNWIVEPVCQCLRIDLPANRHQVRQLEWHFSSESAQAAGQGGRYYPTYQQLWAAVQADERLPIAVDWPMEWAGSLCTELYSATTIVTLAGGTNWSLLSPPADELRAALEQGLALLSEDKVIYAIGVSCCTAEGALFKPIAQMLAQQELERRVRSIYVCDYGQLAPVQTVRDQGLGRHLVVAAGQMVRWPEGRTIGAGLAVAAALSRQEQSLVQVRSGHLTGAYSLTELETFRQAGVLALHQSLGRGPVAYVNCTVEGWNVMHIRVLQELIGQAREKLTPYVGSSNWDGLGLACELFIQTVSQHPAVQDVQYELTMEPEWNRAGLDVSILFYRAVEYITTHIWL